MSTFGKLNENILCDTKENFVDILNIQQIMLKFEQELSLRNETVGYVKLKSQCQYKFVFVENYKITYIFLSWKKWYNNWFKNIRGLA